MPRPREGLPPFPEPIGALFPCRAVVGTNAVAFSSAGASSNLPASMNVSDVDYRLVAFTFPEAVVGSSSVGVPPLTFTNLISAKTVPPAAGVLEPAEVGEAATSACRSIRQ